MPKQKTLREQIIEIVLDSDGEIIDRRLIGRMISDLVAHENQALANQRKGLIEEIVIRLRLLQANLPLTVSDPSYARKQIKLTINELNSLKQKK